MCHARHVHPPIFSDWSQVLLFGLPDLLVASEEGFEVNLLGLTAGVDLAGRALKLPGLGRVETSRRLNRPFR